MLQAFNDDLTVVSFSELTPSPPERRSASRHLSILRTAVLRARSSDELCLVRNISTGGLMAQVFCSLAIDDPVALEFKSGKTVQGHVVWVRDDLIGVQFDDLVDLSVILSNQYDYTFLPLASRAPRVEVRVPARIEITGTWQSVTLNNISQGGARLDLDDAPAIGTRLSLDAPGLSAIPAEVRWQNHNCIGIAFDMQLPFPDVARWVADSHRALMDRDEALNADR